MALDSGEQSKLQVFGNIKLSKDQVETILGRKLSKNEWLTYQDKPTKKHKRSETSKLKMKFKSIAKEAATQAIKRNLKFDEEAKAKQHERYHKLYRNVMQEAAEAGQKRMNRTNIENIPKLHFVKSTFKETGYTIVKTNSYYVAKFRTDLSEWKIYGKVGLFDIHAAIRDLIHKMTANLPANVKIQIGLITPVSDEISTSSKLLSKSQVNDIISEWVNYFMDYKELNIEDITFRLMAIQIPSGGKRPNKIIDTSNSRCIIQIKNKDTLCMVKSIIVAMSVNNIPKLQDIFKGKLTEDEIKLINYRRNIKTEIQDGIISPNEVQYLRYDDTKKLLSVLANAFHRIYKIPIKATGNDFADLHDIEQKLNIEVQVYDLSKTLVYQGHEKEIKLHILLNNKHFDVISNFRAFIGLRTDVENEKLKCKACKNKTQCNLENKKVTCDSCFRLFYGKDCYDMHLTNDKCLSYASLHRIQPPPAT